MGKKLTTQYDSQQHSGSYGLLSFGQKAKTQTRRAAPTVSNKRIRYW